MKNTNKTVDPYANLKRIDRLINNYSKELLTLDPDCNKNWTPNQHLTISTPAGNFKVIFTNNTALVNSHIIVADRIKEEDRYSTLIAWEDSEGLAFKVAGQSQGDSLWSFKIVKLSSEHKNKRFLLKSQNLNTREIDTQYYDYDWDYLKSGQHYNGSTWTKKQFFETTDLFQQSISFYRGDKGIRIKGGQAKSARKTVANKAHGFKGVDCKLHFESADGVVEEIKSMLDCYKIAQGKYGLKKSYRTFVRDIKKGQIELRRSSDHLIICLCPAGTGVSTPTLNIYNNKLNSETRAEFGTLNLEIQQKSTVGVDTPIARRAKTSKSIGLRLKDSVLQEILNALV